MWCGEAAQTKDDGSHEPVDLNPPKKSFKATKPVSNTLKFDKKLLFLKRLHEELPNFHISGEMKEMIRIYAADLENVKA
jgi:hypothetical protein